MQEKPLLQGALRQAPLKYQVDQHGQLKRKRQCRQHQINQSDILLVLVTKPPEKSLVPQKEAEAKP
jgi:hypothetical protein